MPRRKPDEAKELYNKRMKDYMRQRYKERIKLGIEWLGGVCTSCGAEGNLQFDHKERGLKEKNITLLTGRSLKKFLEEVDKCQLLCSQCHRDKTLLDLGFKKEKGVHGTSGNYARYGCRCAACTKVHVSRINEYRWKTGRRKKRL